MANPVGTAVAEPQVVHRLGYIRVQDKTFAGMAGHLSFCIRIRL